MDNWPSKRVAQGGLFHPAKVSYSKDTHDLIKCKSFPILIKKKLPKKKSFKY